MSSSVYVGLSGQVALDRRMTTIANNISNMNTPGFRAEEVKFDSVMSKAGPREVAFASDGDTFLSRRAGPVNLTGNPLDVAIKGDAWFGLSTPSGNVYTRDGRFQITQNGDLLSSAGYPVLDPGGSAIILNPAGGAVTIGNDGSISQDGRQVSSLGLFEIAEDAELSRFENSGVIPSKPAEPVQDMTANGVRQGFVEGANVNPIMEMTKLVMLSRAFESAANAIEQGESTELQAIRQLGPS